MSTETSRQLRLWPGVLLAGLIPVLSFGLPVLSPDLTIYGVFGRLGCAAAIVLWWLFFSRAPWAERLAGVTLMVGGILVTWRFVDVSISTGAMGGLLPMLAVPPLTIALVVWAGATQRLASGMRYATMAATILIACGAWTLVKTGGFDGNFDNDLMWRWGQSKEDRLVADPTAALPMAASAPPPRADAAPISAPSPAPVAIAPTPAAPEHSEPPANPVHHRPTPEWPGFRGPLRDGIARGVKIETDWTKTPPAEIWRRPIGPGWSSFAVDGDRLYTQEQRGEDEIVASYSVATGKPLWSHRDPIRFWESNGGAGPRATPTLHEGRVYTMGATGVLNVLDAETGARIWSHNVAAETHTEIPMWGIASSPLIVDDLVIAAVSGTLAGYEVSSGRQRWTRRPHAASPNGSYSSPQRLTIDGVEQIVLVNEDGVISVVARDGTVLWEYAGPGSNILQPVLTPDGDLLVHEMSMSSGMFVRRLAVAHKGEGWTIEQRWSSDGLKTMFNDFVVHNGHAFGFDGSIFTCVNLTDGKRIWKRGRYGQGQVLLLPDQDVLLVLSEEGDVALVAATPEQYTELAKFKAIEGKTWSHPVVVGTTLLVRNGEEMAAFRLSTPAR